MIAAFSAIWSTLSNYPGPAGCTHPRIASAGADKLEALSLSHNNPTGEKL